MGYWMVMAYVTPYTSRVVMGLLELTDPFNYRSDEASCLFVTARRRTTRLNRRNVAASLEEPCSSK